MSRTSTDLRLSEQTMTLSRRILIGLVVSASVSLGFVGCKSRAFLASQRIKILNGFEVHFHLVNKDFKIPEIFEPDLKPFLDVFLKEAEKAGDKIDSQAIAGIKSMRYTKPHEDLGLNVVAACTTNVARERDALETHTLVWKEIAVVREAKDRFGLNSPAFKVILMHELFHCLKNVEHYDEKLAVMNTEIHLLDKQFVDNADVYIHEMFDPEIVKKMPVRPKAEEISSQNFEVPTKNLSKLIGN